MVTKVPVAGVGVGRRGDPGKVQVDFPTPALLLFIVSCLPRCTEALQGPQIVPRVLSTWLRPPVEPGPVSC